MWAFPSRRKDPADPVRRKLLRTAAAASLVAASSRNLLWGRPAQGAGRPIKIGFINPGSGVLRAFGEGEDFVLAGVRKLLANGIVVNGLTHPVEIIDKDSGSNPSRAAELALGLINSDKVDLMLAASTVDTVNPVSDQCEKCTVPCITTNTPWQMYLRGRTGSLDAGFGWTTADYSAPIAEFKREKVEILTGVLASPAFATFWEQARQQGFRPKIATIAKALLFPSALEELGEHAGGLSTEVWWSPSHPYKSGLSGQNAAEFCDDYQNAANKQWTQPIGFLHALFEVAVDALKRTKNLDFPGAIRDAVRSTNYDSIVGHIAWEGKPAKNIAKTSLVGGQWVPGWKFKNWAAGQKFKYDLVIVNNDADPGVGTQRIIELLSGE